VRAVNIAIDQAQDVLEQSMLGAWLQDPGAAAAAAQAHSTNAQVFMRPENATIFGTMQALTGRGDPVDVVTVFQMLACLGAADRVGGLAYLNALFDCVPSARNVGHYASQLAERANRRRDETTLVALARQAADPLLPAEQYETRKVEALAELQSSEGPHGKSEPFRAVDIACLAEHVPAAPEYWWHGYLPAGLVTALGAHGGTGKSMLALMLCVCIALGRPLFNAPTKRGIAVFYSGEDGADLLAFRLHWICECMGVSPVELEGRLHILDATDGDPVLYRETQEGGRRIASTTTAYDALRRRLDEVQADVLVVDGMSDTFDGNEIQRASVGAYLRALGMLAKPQRAVLLLAHVDKATARGDRPGGGEGYSGSTALHNRVRSRLFLFREKDGGLVLEHQKHNLGRMREPLRLVWPDGRLPDLQAPSTPALQHLTDAVDTKRLLRLLSEFYSRGEYIATAPTSSANAPRMLSGQAGYPAARRAAEVFDLLRAAERAGYIARQAYTNADRKARERWALTYSGCALIGQPAPGAPGATTPQGVAVGADGGEGATPAPPSGARGVGRGGADDFRSDASNRGSA